MQRHPQKSTKGMAICFQQKRHGARKITITRHPKHVNFLLSGKISCPPRRTSLRANVLPDILLSQSDQNVCPGMYADYRATVHLLLPGNLQPVARYVIQDSLVIK
jgi:hypothetical protein